MSLKSTIKKLEQLGYPIGYLGDTPYVGHLLLNDKWNLLGYRLKTILKAVEYANEKIIDNYVRTGTFNPRFYSINDYLNSRSH